MTGDARRVDRQGELGERHVHRVVLGQLEPEPRRSVGRLLHQVDGAGVAAGDLARLAQDQGEQRVGVALGGEADPDLVEVLHLSPGRVGLAAGPGMIARVAQCERQQVRGGRRGHVGVARGGWGRARRDQRHHREIGRPLGEAGDDAGVARGEVDQRDRALVEPRPRQPARGQRHRLEIAGERGEQGGRRGTRRVPDHSAWHVSSVGLTSAVCQGCLTASRAGR